MEKDYLLKSLKALVEKGVKISEIENEIGMPKNNLSAIINRKRVLPKKWTIPLENYISNFDKRKDIETEILKLFEKDREVIMKSLYDLHEIGVSIIEHKENGIERVNPLSKKGFEIMDKLKFADPISEEKSIKIYNATHSDSKMSIQTYKVTDVPEEIKEKVKKMESNINKKLFQFSTKECYSNNQKSVVESEKYNVPKESTEEIQRQLKEWQNKKCPSYMSLEVFKKMQAKEIEELQNKLK